MNGIAFLGEFLPIVVYILLIVLLIIGIILGIKLIITMDKVEKVVDDVNDKVKSLNGFFSLIDFTTDKIAMFSDVLVGALSTGISKVFGLFGNKKKEGKGEENE